MVRLALATRIAVIHTYGAFGGRIESPFGYERKF